MRGWIASLALLGGAASAQAPPPAPPTQHAEPAPLPGCDTRDPANFVGAEKLLDFGEAAVMQVRLAQAGDEDALVPGVSPEFTYGVMSVDVGWGWGEKGIEAFKRFARMIGAGRYAIVVPEGLYVLSTCFRVSVNVTFSDADGLHAQVIQFGFERGVLVSATGRVTNAYREGAMAASPSG
jgi:hypothetical protein